MSARESSERVIGRTLDDSTGSVFSPRIRAFARLRTTAGVRDFVGSFVENQF
jgi:hypothetical protein